MTFPIRIRRVYDAVDPADGIRVLIDRLWPRGLSRDAAQIDLWCKDIAPSTGLRRWFGHRPERWPAFRDRYREELTVRPEAAAAVENLLQIARRQPVTLLYAARDPHHNHAVVLLEYLGELSSSGSPQLGEDDPEHTHPTQR